MAPPMMQRKRLETPSKLFIFASAFVLMKTSDRITVRALKRTPTMANWVAVISALHIQPNAPMPVAAKMERASSAARSVASRKGRVVHDDTLEIGKTFVGVSVAYGSVVKTFALEPVPSSVKSIMTVFMHYHPQFYSAHVHFNLVDSHLGVQCERAHLIEVR